MKQEELEFDVAFSFTQKDEQLASTIYQLLKGRLNCFIYSEQQERLAGKDGEKTFNDVFSKEARIVVILFSRDWGETQWTRIEETAIRNRGFEHGYDFVLLIPTEKDLIPPKWLPKNRIWVGLERWGIESAASIIEARVQDSGGEVKELTVFDKVANADAELKQKRNVEQVLKSGEGATLAKQEFQILKEEFEIVLKEIQEKLDEWSVRIIPNIKDGMNLLSYDHCLTIQWYPFFSGTTHNIVITISNGYYDSNLSKTDFSYNYQQIISANKQFDINQFDQNGWSDKDTKKNFKTTKQLVEEYLNIFFETVRKHRLKQNR